MYFLNVLTANIIYLLVVWTAALDYEKEYGDDYGSEWLYYISDNGSTHVMNFSAIPEESRGMFFGKPYFHLYTRCNPNNYEELTITEEDRPLESIYFNPSNDIKVVTHGWLSSDQTEWLQNMRDTYLRQYDYNVITVDWGELAHNPTYVWPALSTRYVGKRVAKMISSLMRQYQVDGKKFHLIGHSLGAQVMGYAGMFLEGRIYRVTGLDPARPLFELPYMPPNFRLDRSDANFVDIIHTCGGVYGYRGSHGDADFYPNSGKPRQPGCEGKQAVVEGCSHGRSCEFYVESVESSVPFTAYPCDSWRSFENGNCKTNSTQMGDPVDVDSQGDYYLYTKNEPKYAMGVATATIAKDN